MAAMTAYLEPGYTSRPKRSGHQPRSRKRRLSRSRRFRGPTISDAEATKIKLEEERQVTQRANRRPPRCWTPDWRELPMYKTWSGPMINSPEFILCAVNHIY